MALTYYAGWDFERLDTMTLEITTNEPETLSVTYTSGTYAHVDMSALTGTSTYTAFITQLITTLNAEAINEGSTRTFNASTFANGVYTITANTGTIQVTTNTSTAMRRLLGFSSLPTSAAISATSDVRPYYLINPYITARSNVTDDYEGGEISYDAEADDGNSFGISRLTAPLYHDWVQGFESKEASFKNSATAAVPFTYQHLFEHCRNVEPIWVLDSMGGSGTDNMAVKLRADGSVWRPQRVTADYDGQWNIPFNTRVIVTSAGVSRA